MDTLAFGYILPTTGPVSYTHLDVYKRQDDDFFSDEKEMPSVQEGDTLVANAGQGITAGTSTYSSKSVSYTHLFRLLLTSQLVKSKEYKRYLK